MADFEPIYETERRFIVHDPAIVRASSAPEYIAQGYVFSMDGYAIRVRVLESPRDSGNARAFMTGKGPRVGLKREEYEIEVDPLWGRQVVDRCRHKVVKYRYQVLAGQTWEVDQFLGENEGL